MDENLGKGRPVVLSLHGIRTRGKWQKDLTRSLNEAGFVHEPLDFGFFRALSLLNPRSRRKRVDWFLEQYTAAIGGLNARPSIIAHSFGSYLVARTLQIYKHVTFDKVILCGSIVRRDFPWSKIIERKQVSQVLHDYGKLDVWARLVEWVVSDAGQSGLHGFRDLANGQVVEQCHPEFRHSDYFFKLNYRENWIPFLRGTHKAENTDLTPAPPSWRFLIAVTLLSALVVAGAYYALKYFNNHSAVLEKPQSMVVVPHPPSPPADAKSFAPPAGNGGDSSTQIQHQVDIKSDASCSLTINGNGAGNLESGVSMRVSIKSSVAEIACVSREYPIIADSRSLVLRREGVNNVSFHLKGKIENQQRLRRTMQVEHNRSLPTVDNSAVVTSNAPASEVKQSASLVTERYSQCVQDCESRTDSCKQSKVYAERAKEWADKAEKYPQTSAWDTYRKYDALAEQESMECIDRCDRRCD